MKWYARWVATGNAGALRVGDTPFCWQIVQENQDRDAKITEQRQDHDALRTSHDDAVKETKDFRDGLQSGRTTISSKAVYVEAEKAQLSEVMHNRKATIKRLDASVFECKEGLERKGDVDDLQQCQTDIEAHAKTMVKVKSTLSAVGIDVDGKDGDGPPGGVFVEMANNIKLQKAQLTATDGTCATPLCWEYLCGWLTWVHLCDQSCVESYN